MKICVKFIFLITGTVWPIETMPKSNANNKFCFSARNKYRRLSVYTIQRFGVHNTLTLGLKLCHNWFLTLVFLIGCRTYIQTQKNPIELFISFIQVFILLANCNQLTFILLIRLGPIFCLQIVACSRKSYALGAFCLDETCLHLMMICNFNLYCITVQYIS